MAIWSRNSSKHPKSSIVAEMSVHFLRKHLMNSPMIRVLTMFVSIILSHCGFHPGRFLDIIYNAPDFTVLFVLEYICCVAWRNGLTGGNRPYSIKRVLTMFNRTRRDFISFRSPESSNAGSQLPLEVHLHTGVYSADLISGIDHSFTCW